MKVKELIQILSQEDPEMRVVVDAYESGYDELDRLYQVEIARNPNADQKTWEGDFDEMSTSYKITDQPVEIALCLPRKS